MRRLALAALTGLSLIAFVENAAAQAPNPAAGGPTLRPTPRPPVTPYLDLVAGQGAIGGVGYQYYRQFLPQQQLRQGIQQNNQALQAANRNLIEQTRTLQSEISGLTPTGIGAGQRAAGFMTHQRYFGLPGAPAGLR